MEFNNVGPRKSWKIEVLFGSQLVTADGKARTV